MNVLTSTTASGMHLAQQRLAASAHNVANVQTPGFSRQQVHAQVQPPLAGVSSSVGRASPAADNGADVSLEKEALEQMQSKQMYQANAQQLRRADQMMGSLLDERA